MTTEATVVFVAVVAARFLAPLLIPRFPLPAIVTCLVLDGVDQSVFQAFGLDPPGYQNYDKAMDLFYLSIAFLSSLQNWTSRAALQISRFLFFFRMVGVLVFELTGVRAVLLLFPNTFEYFFICYEALRLRWDPRRFGLRFWLLAAALIWVVIKLPQEYWIHVAQLDFTDAVAEVPWFGPAVLAGLAALGAVLWFVVRPRLPARSWPWRIEPEPLPHEIDTAAKRDSWMAANLRVVSWWSLEKVALIGLLSTIYARILPGLNVSELRMFVGVALYVLANVLVSLVVARRVGSRTGLLAGFTARVLVNVALVLAARTVLGASALALWETLFFILLVSLLITYHDRFAPVSVVRAEHDRIDR